MAPQEGYSSPIIASLAERVTSVTARFRSRVQRSQSCGRHSQNSTDATSEPRKLIRLTLGQAASCQQPQ